MNTPREYQEALDFLENQIKNDWRKFYWVGVPNDKVLLKTVKSVKLLQKLIDNYKEEK